MWEKERVQELTSNIPHAPGVYLMRDRAGRVIYVGKAVDLANRVAQYFHPSGDPRPFVRILSGVLDRIDTVLTSNEKEALLLENELIKKHRPPFNILLRDDKSFLYLRLDPQAPVPRLELVRRRKQDGALYFGPYHSAASIRHTHALVSRYFGLRTCSDAVFRNRSRPCLEYQMGRCLAPCVRRVSPRKYAEQVEAAVLFLKGRRKEVVKLLTDRMILCSFRENFEEAAKIRDQIKAVQEVMTSQGVVLPASMDMDAVGLAREGDTVAFAVLRFEAGVLTERVPYVQSGVLAADKDLIESFLVQYYARSPIPAQVVLPRWLAGSTQTLAQVLADRRPEGVAVKVAWKGQLNQVGKMADENAAAILKEALASHEARHRAAQRLAEVLGLRGPPRRIDGFDMSTLMSAEPVGAMVVFMDGKPERRAYRTFSVRLEDGPGDVGLMHEVLRRRYSKVPPEEVPDLVMVDGGEAQVRVAAAVLAEVGMSTVPVVGLAKSKVVDRGGFGAAMHSPERLYVLESSEVDGVRESAVRLVVPQQNDPGLHLLMRVRDEAHRFAVTFHRKRRHRRQTASVLEGIPGLGPRRRSLLLRAMGSVANIRAATLEQLKAVKGIPAAVAEEVYRRMQGG